MAIVSETYQFLQSRKSGAMAVVANGCSLIEHSVANLLSPVGTYNWMRIARVRFWIETVALVSSVACVLAAFLALCLATLGAAESSANDLSQPQPTNAPSLSESGAAHLSYVSAQSSQPQASPTHAPAPPETYEGIITDTHCGAKHSAKIGLSAADCTRVCVHSGDSFALVDGDKVYVLEGESAALKQSAGERVKILGILNGTTIAVSSVIKL
jgi:hypothetical protein